MNPQPHFRGWLHGALAGLALTCATAPAQNLIVHRLNVASSANNWVKWWGSCPTVIAWDGTRDVGNNAASGSLKTTVQFAVTNYGGDNQFALRGALSGDGNLNGLVVDATKYDRVEFDLYWDVTSPQRPSGDLGGLDVGLVPTDYSQRWLTNIGVQIVDGWQHIKIPIAPSITDTNIGGLVFKMWSGDAASGQTGPAIFWVDNIKLVPKGFITDFDNDAYITGNAFWNWWGGASRTVEWDGAHDAKGDTNSGALKLSVTFSGVGDNQYSEGMSLSGAGNYNGGVTIHTVNFASVDFDLLWDTNSTVDLNTLNTTGDPQGLGIGLASTGWGQTWPPNVDQPKPVADGVWHHVSVPLNPSWPDIAGFIYKKWFPVGPTGTLNYWVDNLQFKPSAAAIPPPTMSISKATKGLNLFASQPGSQYQRQGIRSVPADGVWWVGQPDPVTYSLTLADVPGSAYGGFQTHLFLVPDNASGNAPDYSDANAIMLDIKRQGESQGIAYFRWKTNQPNGNGQMYSAAQGALGPLVDSSVTGTWSVRFNNNTNIILTGPSGATTNLVMPSDAAALFQPTSVMGTIFGVQPNQPANIGQASVFSRIRITSGANTIVDDKFPDETLSADWVNRLDNAAGMFVVTDEQSLWLGWTLPDADFVLQEKHTLGDAFTPSALTPILNGSTRHILLRSADVVDQTYYGLKK